MATLLVRHRVRDYDRWKRIFDAYAAERAAAGSLGGRVFRDGDDPEDVVIVLEWADMDRARDYAEREDIIETMERAGVVGEPDYLFLAEVDAPNR